MAKKFARGYPLPATKGKLGISHAQMYKIGLRPYRHDLKSMIIAYGAEFIMRQVENIDNNLQAEHAKKPRIKVTV